MKLKKMLSAVLAGVLLIGCAVSVSAGKVYTSDDFKKPVYNYYLNPYYYNNGYFYNWIYDGPKLEANWNPVTGKYDTCTCAYCQGVYTPSGYYWVNGVLCSAKDYYVNYVPHYVTVTPSTTVTSPVISGETSKETGVIYNESSIPSSAIKRPGTVASSDVASDNVVITESGKVYIKNPSILGGFSSSLTIPGKYYAYDKVDINAFFAQNTYSMYMYPGDIQTMGTGFKMVSSDSSVIRIYNSDEGQHMQALKTGSAYVYLYTGGGVPFMRLYVNVGGGAYNTVKGYIDIEPASWQLKAKGDSTDIVIKADRDYGDIKLDVVKGNGYIGKDGKLYANGNGAIVLKAYSARYPAVQGFAIIYVGEYVNALYDGYWTSANGCITGTYWNPYLWSYDGYKINGWILTNTGVYLPVISKVESTLKPGSTTTVYSDLYDLLYDCHGDVDTLYKLLWQKYQNNKPAQSFSSLYQSALDEIMKDIANDYYKQMH